MEIYLDYEYRSHSTGEKLGRETEVFENFEELLEHVADYQISDINAVHVIQTDQRTGTDEHTRLTAADIEEMLIERDEERRADLRHARAYAVPA